MIATAVAASSARCSAVPLNAAAEVSLCRSSWAASLARRLRRCPGVDGGSGRVRRTAPSPKDGAAAVRLSTALTHFSTPPSRAAVGAVSGGPPSPRRHVLPPHHLSPLPFARSRRRYGTSVRVIRDESTPPHPPGLEPYLRVPLAAKIDGDNDDGSFVRWRADESRRAPLRGDDNFSLTFLGTSSGGPLNTARNASSLCLHLGGQTYLFDCAEGTQRQTAFLSRPRPSDITRIFITHLHGDHLYGLPGLILKSQEAARGRAGQILRRKAGGRLREFDEAEEDLFDENGRVARPVLEVYGPPGLYNYICASLALSCSRLHALRVVVYELTGGTQEDGPHGIKWSHARRPLPRNRNPFLGKFYPEFSQPMVVRRNIPRSLDGTWLIDDFADITERDALGKGGYKHTAPNDPTGGRGRSLRVAAAEVEHIPGVQTFGYIVEEPPPPRNIDVAKAEARGVAGGPKFRLLKNGIPVERDDGSGVLVKPEEVYRGEALRGRKLAVVGDNWRMTEAMVRLCAGADVLVHEATALDGWSAEQARERGHSTAVHAGRVARSLSVPVLALNHIGATVDTRGRGSMVELMEKCTEASGGTCKVVPAFDFMELWVPRGGFGFLRGGDAAEEDKAKGRASFAAATRKDSRSPGADIPSAAGSITEQLRLWRLQGWDRNEGDGGDSAPSPSSLLGIKGGEATAATGRPGNRDSGSGVEPPRPERGHEDDDYRRVKAGRKR